MSRFCASKHTTYTRLATLVYPTTLSVTSPSKHPCVHQEPTRGTHRHPQHRPQHSTPMSAILTKEECDAEYSKAMTGLRPQAAEFVPGQSWQCSGLTALPTIEFDESRASVIHVGRATI
ncbi:unnamed protein product, partial [Pylaiella littoralis]